MGPDLEALCFSDVRRNGQVTAAYGFHVIEEGDIDVGRAQEEHDLSAMVRTMIEHVQEGVGNALLKRSERRGVRDHTRELGMVESREIRAPNGVELREFVANFAARECRPDWHGLPVQTESRDPYVLSGNTMGEQLDGSPKVWRLFTKVQ